jgi:hypothetical protein
VEIPAKLNITALDYLKYLVQCMVSDKDTTSGISKSTKYALTFYDDVSLLDGPYFRVDSITSKSSSKTSLDSYQLDIGYPTKDLV